MKPHNGIRARIGTGLACGLMGLMPLVGSAQSRSLDVRPVYLPQVDLACTTTTATVIWPSWDVPSIDLVTTRAIARIYLRFMQAWIGSNAYAHVPKQGATNIDEHGHPTIWPHPNFPFPPVDIETDVYGPTGMVLRASFDRYTPVTGNHSRDRVWPADAAIALTPGQSLSVGSICTAMFHTLPTAIGSWLLFEYTIEFQ